MSGRAAFGYRFAALLAAAWQFITGYVPSRTAAWLLLVLSGLTEVGWAVGIKYTNGFTRLWPSVWTVGCLVIGFPLLAVVMRTVPASTAYAVWTGIGIAGTGIIGMTLLGEPGGTKKVLCLTLILLGVVGLKVLSGPER